MVFERRKKIRGILRDADRAGRDGERRAERDLPDEEEGEELSPARGAIDALEILIGAAGLREGSAEFGPDETVANGEQRAEDPAKHGLRSAHRADDERQGDEGADADHVDHVEDGRVLHRELASELWGDRGYG